MGNNIDSCKCNNNNLDQKIEDLQKNIDKVIINKEAEKEESKNSDKQYIKENNQKNIFEEYMQKVSEKNKEVSIKINIEKVDENENKENTKILGKAFTLSESKEDNKLEESKSSKYIGIEKIQATWRKYALIKKFKKEKKLLKEERINYFNKLRNEYTKKKVKDAEKKT